MSVPRQCLLAAAVGLGIVPSLQADEPGRLDVDRSRPAQAAPSANQKTANQIAEALRQSPGCLPRRHARVSAMRNASSDVCAPRMSSIKRVA